LRWLEGVSVQKDIRRHLEGNLNAYHGEKNKNERYHQEKKEIFYREEEKEIHASTVYTRPTSKICAVKFETASNREVPPLVVTSLVVVVVGCGLEGPYPNAEILVLPLLV